MKRRWIGFFCAAALLLSGCGLMPKEEPLQQAPVIHTQVEESFEFAYVERGDVIKSTRINCTYMPARSETYKFGAGGETLDEIFVQVGDAVKEGQLLYEVQLDKSNTSKTAPASGVFKPLVKVGAFVKTGMTIARIEEA